MRSDPSLKTPYVFMHIGKTAGTTIKSVVQALEDHGKVAPLVMGHTVSLQKIIEKRPRAKIAIVLRDPLERIISGFNSRLRQGRPVYDRIWTVREAVAFGFFDNVEEYLRACISKRDIDVSAARFASMAITHVKNSYVRLFVDADSVRSNIDRFYCIGHISNMQETLSGIFSPLAADPAFYEGTRPANVSTSSSAEVLSKFTPEERLALKAYFNREYDIYNEFLRHVSVKIADTH